MSQNIATSLVLSLKMKKKLQDLARRESADRGMDLSWADIVRRTLAASFPDEAGGMKSPAASGEMQTQVVREL